MRTDWTLATGDTVWSSVRVDPDVAPRGWQHEQKDGTVALKCAKRGFYHNELVTPVVFHYELPARRPGTDETILDRLLTEARATEKRIEIQLFWAQNAFDHYLGEWVVYGTKITPTRTSLELRRLSSQSPVLLEAYRCHKRARSRSEARHLNEIRTWLPGWTVAHEPEAATGLDAPVVVDGQVRDFAGDNYTHDYVAASPRGCKRLCIESKASDDGLTEEAKQKCRRLRDGGLCRVVAMIGHGSNLHWHDFGPPNSAVDEERRFDVHQSKQLNDSLGIADLAARPENVPHELCAEQELTRCREQDVRDLAVHI